MPTEPLMDQFKQELDLYYRSPESIDATTMDILEQALDEKLNIVDPSSPFIFLLEASTIHTSAAMNSFDTSMRRTYPKLASSMDELYNHLSDADLMGRFAAPSRTNLVISIPVEVLRENAVWDTGRAVFRLRMPKDTVIRYGGVNWMIHYPVDLLISQSGAIQAAYDFTQETPLKASSELNLTYHTVQKVNGTFFYLTLPVEQISVTTETAAVSPSAPYNSKIPLTDDFLYVRAYHRQSGGGWVEMETTHSLSVYDSAKPTMGLRVLDSTLTVSIPAIYSVNEALGDTIRVDTFTTRGAMDLDLSDYSSADASIYWQDLNGDTSPYEEALASINTLDIYAPSEVVSGRAALSFTELKDRVIYRSDSSRVAITNIELTYRLKDLGYELSRMKDSIAGRVFTCKRDLSEDGEKGIGVRIAETIIDSSLDGYGTSLTTKNDRITVSNRAVYKNTGSGTVILTDAEKEQLLLNREGNSEDFLKAMNEGNLFYSPFFYVLDKAFGAYLARPYHLDDVYVSGRGFKDANVGLPYAFYSVDADLKREGETYILTVEATAPEGITGFIGQLQFEDSAGQVFYKNSDTVTYDGNTVFLSFKLTTTFDIDQEDRLEFTNFTAMGGTVSALPIPLSPEFNLFFMQESELDVDSVFDHLIEPLDTDWVAVSQESISVVLGKSLDGLFSWADVTLTAPVYETYGSDIPTTRPSDVYETDDEGKLVFNVGEDGLEGNLLHRKGDVVLDEEGEPIIARFKGERVFENGSYIIKEPSRMVWSFEPITLDARYRFATSTAAAAKREKEASRVSLYLENDIRPLEDVLAARTELVFQPNNSTGTASAEVDGGILDTLDTALSFKVNFTLSATGFADQALKSHITKACSTKLKEVLYSNTFTLSRLVSSLHGLSDEIINVYVDNPLGEWSMACIVSKDKVFSLRSSMVLYGNGIYDVVDDLTVTFDKLA